jgi:hypothetical protein
MRPLTGWLSEMGEHVPPGPEQESATAIAPIGYARVLGQGQ